MPRLPDTYGARPTPRANNAIVNFDGGAIPAALAQLSGTAERLVGVSMEQQMAAREKEQAALDEQAVFAARRQLDDWERAKIYDPEKGAVTRMGRDAFGLSAELPKEFDAFAAEVAKTLGSERQRAAFNRLAMSRREQVGAWADRHALQQRQVFAEAQYQADIKSARERAASLAVVDPDRVAAELGVMQLRIVSRGKELGRPEEWVADQVKEQSSQVHLGAVMSLLESNNPLKAQEYLKSHGKGLKFDDYIKAMHMVNQQVDTLSAFKKADEAVRQEVPKLAPTDGDRLFNLVLPRVMQAESGGRRFGPDGKLLEGPPTKYGTAKGEMQVLDGTAKDPGLGVAPAKDDSPDERARVGRDYLRALLIRYDGDVAKATAAYNWGFANVDQAVLRAASRPGGDWFAFAPAETRAYVEKITKGFEGGAGRPPEPTLQDVHQRLRADPELARSPRALKIALEQSTAQWGDAMKAKKEFEDAAYADAVQALFANGGRFSMLPPRVLSNVPPEKRVQLMNAAARIAKGDDTTDPWVYLSLSDPVKLKSKTDAEFVALRPMLSESDFRHFAAQRNIQKGQAKPGDPGELDAAAVNAVLKSRLGMLKIDATPKDTDTTGVERVSAVQKFARESVLRAQAVAGKKFNDREIEEHLDALFVKDVYFKTSVLGFDTGGKYERLLATKYSDLPSKTVDKLKEDLARQGNNTPTQGDILKAYFESRVLMQSVDSDRRKSGLVR